MRVCVLERVSVSHQTKLIVSPVSFSVVVGIFQTHIKSKSTTESNYSLYFFVVVVVVTTITRLCVCFFLFQFTTERSIEALTQNHSNYIVQLQNVSSKHIKMLHLFFPIWVGVFRQRCTHSQEWVCTHIAHALRSIVAFIPTRYAISHVGRTHFAPLLARTFNKALNLHNFENMLNENTILSNLVHLQLQIRVITACTIEILPHADCN